MAIGLSLMIGIVFPLNFNSPYQAVSLIDFWRRWNMTLSRFLRDYLYIPLGGNRRGPLRRYLNLLITMLLGGLWHGASWNFAVWGGIHGLGLLVNHAWQSTAERTGWRVPCSCQAPSSISGSSVLKGAIRPLAVFALMSIIAAPLWYAGSVAFVARGCDWRDARRGYFMAYCETAGFAAYDHAPISLISSP